MKSRNVILIVSANLAALLLLAVLMPYPMVSPGKLIDAHAELAGDCFACHTAFIGSAPAKCIECHELEKIGLETTKGLIIGGEKKNVAFHQELIEADCIACHSDHKGVQAFRPISQFSHGLLERTAQERCDGCHTHPGDALHQRIEENCGECHSQEDWKPATFDHERHFRFDSDHTTECVTCHVDDNFGGYTCYGCHEHSRSEIREEHVEEGISDYENCAECHRSGDEDEAKELMRSRGPRSEIEGLRYGRRESEHDEHKKRDDDDD